MIRTNFIVKSLFMLLCVFSLLAAPVSFAQTAEKVDELIVRSGLQRQIGLLPEVVSASFEQRMSQDANIKPEEAAKLRDAISQSVTPAAMLDSIKGHISAQLAEPDLDVVLAWLNSPLGLKITAMEENASSAQAFMELEKFAMGLESDPPDPKRVEVLQELDQAARMTEFTTDMKVDMIVTMTAAMATASGRTDLTKEELLSNLESNRAQIKEGSAQEVLITGLYTYQTLTVDELKEYVTFYKTESGQKYANVITVGLLAALSKSSKDMGERLGKVIKDGDAKDSAASQ